MRRRALVGLALSGALAGCAVPGRSDDTAPTALTRPGWCHRLSDPVELYAASDVAPPVPCGTPHRSETFAMVRLPLALTRLPDPPEHAGDLANVVCGVPIGRRLRAYLGADDFDRHWGIDVWLKVPTRSEWEKGLRLGRCDLVLGRGGVRSAPVLAHSFRGALRRTDSAVIRHCRHGKTSLTCDRPHTAEEVGGWTGIVGSVYPGVDAAARELREQCWRNAERYTGGAIDELAMRPVPGRLTAKEWRAGRRTTDCWIEAEDGRTTRGTLRADLTNGTPR